ncbi:MAG: dUTP diphosphatase [Adlercreutzia equolifaciens]
MRYRLAIPEGYAGLIIPRSGLAARQGISIVNAPGLIDSGYRGEIKVPLINLDPTETFNYEKGERIAQLAIIATPHYYITLYELPESRAECRAEQRPFQSRVSFMTDHRDSKPEETPELPSSWELECDPEIPSDPNRRRSLRRIRDRCSSTPT